MKKYDYAANRTIKCLVCRIKLQLPVCLQNWAFASRFALRAKQTFVKKTYVAC